MEDSDEHIAYKVQNGDTEAYGVLIDRYEPKLRRYANKFLLFNTEETDLVQDVLAKAYINIQEFDTNKRFSPWIYRIAHNEFINALKKRQRSPLHFFDPDILFPHLVANETADGPTLDKELEALINSSIGELDPKYREPLLLHYYEHMSYQDIGEILQIPISTVGARIVRAKQKLKAKCKEKTDHE